MRRQPHPPANDVLERFAERFDRCWLCGVTEPAWSSYPFRLQIHHAVRGANRAKAKYEECVLIRTCPMCHADKFDGMEPAKQLAIIIIHNPAAYDRLKFNELRGRAPESISEAEVQAWVDQLTAERKIA